MDQPSPSSGTRLVQKGNMATWLVAGMRTGEIMRSRSEPVLDSKSRFVGYRAVQVTDRGPEIVRIVIQRCDNEKDARALYSAYMGSVKHQIIIAKECKTPEDIIRAWKDKAILL